MLEQTLKKVIPHELNSFSKLTEGHDSYYFTSWAEENGMPILRYWFWNRTKTRKNGKRVFVNEIENLLKHPYRTRCITRANYLRYCTRTKSGGDSGFAVIVRILEYFQVVEVVDGKYTIKSTENIRRLLD
jgi:hypothetical protein